MVYHTHHLQGLNLWCNTKDLWDLGLDFYNNFLLPLLSHPKNQHPAKSDQPK